MDVQLTTLQQRVPATGIAGRSAKAFALLLVAVALRVATPAAPPARTALVVLPGVDAEGIAGLEARGVAWGGALLDGDAGLSGGAFWRRFLERLSQGAPVGRRLLGVPVALLSGVSTSPSAPVEGFVGGNSGVVLDSRDVALRRFPPAYGAASEMLPPALESLPRGERSGWFVMTDPGGRAAGTFLAVRGGEDSWFFSPVHRETDATGDDAKAEVSRPFFRGIAPELVPAVVSYLRALGDRRFERALPALLRADPAGGIVFFDLAAEEVTEAFLPAEAPARIAQEVHGELVARIEKLAGALGPEGVVVLAGGPHLGRADGGGAWYRVLSGTGGPVRGVGDLDLAARGDLVLRYLLGEPLDAAERAAVPPELLALYPRKRASSAPAAPGAEAGLHAWSAESIGEAQASTPGAS